MGNIRRFFSYLFNEGITWIVFLLVIVGFIYFTTYDKSDSTVLSRWQISEPVQHPDADAVFIDGEHQVYTSKAAEQVVFIDEFA